MLQAVYMMLFIFSVVFIKLYLDVFSKQHGIHYISFVILGAVANLNYWLMSMATTAEAAMVAQKTIYAVMLFFPVVFLSMACDVCEVRSNGFRTLSTALSFVFIMLVMTTERTGLFYRSYWLDVETHMLVKEYGIAHSVYYGYLAATFLTTLGMILINRRKKKISTVCCNYVIGVEVAVLTSLLLEKVLPFPFQYDTIGILLTDAALLVFCHRLPLYDVRPAVYEAVDESGNTGILLFDKGHRLLGFNGAVSRELPEFETLRLDEPLPAGFPHLDVYRRLMDSCGMRGHVHSETLIAGDKFFSVETSFLLLNGRVSGYQMLLRDITINQQHLELLENFNMQLKEEVERKARELLRIQDSVVVGIAEIVESRDNSTGGHIKRTSRGVEILSDYLCRTDHFDVSPDFYQNVVKAAPLHDLGKVAVPDDILKKPGRFTPEEFEQMKRHAAAGGAVVRKVLENINDPDFVNVAANVANYHHERWDGKGYPDGLSGEAIPPEARVMAIADVYDALVSKRCYKEAFDFERARSIILEGMGTQFDPNLKECFEACLPRLEAYYAERKNAE